MFAFIIVAGGYSGCFLFAFRLCLLAALGYCYVLVALIMLVGS